MNDLHSFAVAAGAVLGGGVILWAFSLWIRNSSIIDIAWGPGFVLCTGIYVVFTETLSLRLLIVLALVAIWGTRLAVHIFIRNYGKPEDFRYQAFREQAGPSYWWTSYFKVFFLQGLLILIISAPILVISISGQPAFPTALDIIALGLWLLGMVFEVGSDLQLRRFKMQSQNQSRLLSTGFWSMTRHPNYFGDALVWWGIYVFATSSGAGVITVFAPTIMTILLIRVSGVGMLEPHLIASKEEYRNYMLSTPAFFPRVSAWRSHDDEPDDGGT